MIRRITHKQLTWNSILWSLLINGLFVFGCCWGLVYLHVFRVTEVLIGVALGIFNGIWLSGLVFFIVVPNFNSTIFHYVFTLFCIRTETVDLALTDKDESLTSKGSSTK